MKAREAVPGASPAFDRISAVLRRDGGVDAPVVSSRRAFGSEALKVGGRIFAMPARGTVVLKLPRERVTALLSAGLGEPYDAGRGRPLREWVALCGPETEWLELAREARAFVAGSARG